MTLPKQYEYLLSEPGPKMILEALKEYGTLETPGIKNNAKIIGWAKEVGEDVAKMYKADSIPWCGLFMAVIAKRAGKSIPAKPLWALNWGNFGHDTEDPMLGDVLVFVRKTETGGEAGHVSLYVGEDESAFHILGGNQSDAVTITRMAKTRLYKACRPDYHLQPANVRNIFLGSSGKLSASEQ